MTAIAIGSAATDRAASTGSYWTIVDKGSTANATGKITSVQMWSTANRTGVKVATFYVVSGNNLTARSVATIGNVAAGYTETTVDLDVTAGDYIGVYGTGAIDAITSGGAGVWMKSGDQTACSNTAFTAQAGYTISLYGTGSTASVNANGTALDTFTSADSNTAKKGGKGSLSETITFSESDIAKKGGKTAFTDTVAFIESYSYSASSVVNINGIAADSFTVSDLGIGRKGSAINIIEPFIAAEYLNGLKGAKGSLSQSSAFSESYDYSTYKSARSAVVTDSFIGSESISITRKYKSIYRYILKQNRITGYGRRH